MFESNLGCLYLDKFCNQWEAFKSLMDISHSFSINKSLIAFRCIITAMHYKTITEKVMSIGVPVLVGPPSTGKTGNSYLFSGPTLTHNRLNFALMLVSVF